jgi:hypothetical protein
MKTPPALAAAEGGKVVDHEKENQAPSYRTTPHQVRALYKQTCSLTRRGKSLMRFSCNVPGLKSFETPARFATAITVFNSH